MSDVAAPPGSGSAAPSLGWLGAGRMGSAMAGRLLDAGEAVVVWNRTPAKADPLVARGATVAGTLGELAGCEVVFVTVGTAADLEEVVVGERGLLRAARPPRIVVDCSTISPESSAAVRAAAAEVGVELLAAPVIGNPHVVSAGGACMVASGARPCFDRVRPYLEKIGKVVVYAGPGEQSRLVKLCVNLYLGMMVQALVEVVSLAEKGGTDRRAFLELLNGTVLGSDWVRRRTDDLVARDWTPTFTTELLRKDFDLGLAAARSLEVPMPVGAAVHQLIQSAIGTGNGQDDFLSLYEQQARSSALGQP
ncbi:MAG: NAD(P)-dependent oxidoreductase [Acidimicrobiales bacterium]